MLQRFASFSSGKPASHGVGAMAAAPGDEISCWVYLYTAGYGHSNPWSI